MEIAKIALKLFLGCDHVRGGSTVERELKGRAQIIDRPRGSRELAPRGSSGQSPLAERGVANAFLSSIRAI